MSSSSTGDSSRDMARVEKELLARWPESRLEPSLTRINALVDLLGSPHRAMPVVQVAGTNGKTTTARSSSAASGCGWAGSPARTWSPSGSGSSWTASP
jgi:hypothetical protein